MRRSVALALNILSVTVPSLTAGAERPLQFNRDIRPILAEACFKCHGPDPLSRQADLRLDTREGLFTPRGSAVPVVADQPAASTLLQRVLQTDPELQMPPPASGKSLTPAQRATLQKWIEQGASWEDHWAFSAPERSDLPVVQHPAWSTQAIDRFIQAELYHRRWVPRREAAPETLIRRVTLDLTGLPPTPEEVYAFLSDPAPDRYDRLVDRLLASPRSGEHLAVDWLDVARYADTSGYQNDGPREMWRWRDWVIGAFNDNLPFDDFTVAQLAGDLVLAERERRTNPAVATTAEEILRQTRGFLPRDPQAIDWLIATGFQRNHRGNAEGGIIPEEYAVEYVADRVDTAGAAWLGLTIGCARCHTHKYDPITQADYYRLFAYFNQVPEYGRAIKEGNSPPYIKAPTPAQWAELQRLESQQAAAEEAWLQLQSVLQAEQQTWERSLDSAAPVDLRTAGAPLIHLPLDNDLTPAAGLSAEPTLRDGPAVFVHGPRQHGLQLNGGQHLDAGDVGKFSYFEAFTVAAWIKPEAPLGGGIVSRTSDDAYADGWAFQLDNGHLQVNLVKRWLDDAIRVETESTLRPGVWQHVAMSYDGTRRAQGIVIAIDGRPQALQVHYDFLNQDFANKEPLRIGSTGSNRPLTGALAEVQIYRGVLTPEELSTLVVRESVTDIAALPLVERTPAQAAKLRAAFLRFGAAPNLRAAAERRRKAQGELAKFLEKTVPTAMVMVDLASPRPTNVLQRGAYDRPGEPVAPGVPAAISGPTGPVTGNRLDLARWMVHRRNPLTARVAVNRVWQRLFGTGLVKTSEDFGIQGEPPSHPELLDWLAVEFMESGWDLKHLQRLIVTSAAYRQASDVTPELLQADPENRWLARGPRLRLSAEMLRDQALAHSGLLEERLGGPSIKPYQPAGLWQEIASDTAYEPDQAPDIYRRSVYCYVKRTVANPTFALFDAATRETCTVRRGRTNTPLQALAVWNDPTFVEAARVLAERSLAESPRESRAVLLRMFQRVTARPPSDVELDDLVAMWTRYRASFEADLPAARALLKVGSPPGDVADPASVAAYALVASVLWNLDEVVTKE